MTDEFGSGNRLRVVVADTGPGIAANKLARLFTPFDRLGAEQSGVEGTGLGLALCQRLAHAMGGTVGVRSSAGSGSTFWVELPLTDSPLSRLTEQFRSAATESAPGERRRILHIEDNLSNLTLIEQTLSDEPNIDLITAMQGQMGLDLARKHLPDLILLDLHLPDLPGWEVLARLKKEKATAEIPVVIITADATAGQVDRLKNAGASAYLTKPIDLAEFYRVIAETGRGVAAPPACVAA